MDICRATEIDLDGIMELQAANQPERGGSLSAMFAELQRVLPGREGILFIRRDNQASLRAHAKMVMHEVAGFVFNGNHYVALSYVGRESD